MPTPTPALTKPQFVTKWTDKFGYNVWQLIDDASFREFTADLAATFGNGVLPALQTFRFRTRAEADASAGGQVLEEIDYATLYTYTRVLVEFYREDPTDLTEKPHRQELIAVFDPSAPPARFGYRTAGGALVGDAKLGLSLVRLDDPAATGVLAYNAQDATLTAAGIPRYYDAGDGQGVLFYSSTGPLPVPVPAPQGNTGGGWELIAKPSVPGGNGTVTGNLPPPALQTAYRLSSPAPVGYETLAAALGAGLYDTLFLLSSSYELTQPENLGYSVVGNGAYLDLAGFAATVMNGAQLFLLNTYDGSANSQNPGGPGLIINNDSYPVYFNYGATGSHIELLNSGTVVFTGVDLALLPGPSSVYGIEGAGTIILGAGTEPRWSNGQQGTAFFDPRITIIDLRTSQAGITAAQLEAVRTRLLASPTQTGSYYLSAADAGNVVLINSSAPSTVTIVDDTALAVPVGTVIEVSQEGAGQVNIVAITGVTLSYYAGTKTAGQYASVGLRKVAVNQWRVTNGVA